MGIRDARWIVGRKRWLETPLWQFNLDLTLSEEDIQFCYVLNNITLHLSRSDCNLLLILTLKPFFFIPVIFDQKLQGILWIFETHLGTQVTPCNLKLFQPASLGLVPLLL